MTLPTVASLSAWSPRSPKEACTSSPLGIRYSHLANVGSMPFIFVFFLYLPACSWKNKITSRLLSFRLVLPGFHSSVKLVVFTVFYGDHLISHWTAAVYGSHCCNGTSSAFFGSECDVVLCVCQIKNDGCDVCVILTCQCKVRLILNYSRSERVHVVLCLSGDPRDRTDPLPPRSRAGLHTLRAPTDGLGCAGTHTPALHP